jgi:hypothetical protein
MLMNIPECSSLKAWRTINRIEYQTFEKAVNSIGINWT